MASLFSACPCPMGASDKKRLVEMSPFRTAGSGSDNDSNSEDAPPATMADRAKGWLSMAAAPITALKERNDKAAARAARLDVLKAGAQMQLLPDGRSGQPTPVRVSLSADSSMITWSGAGGSGVMALSAVRDVKPVLQSGFFRSGGPVPGQWMLVADDQTVRFEASSEEEKQVWLSTVEECSQEQVEAKTGRKLAAQARRKMGLEERRRDAERRKAEVMKNCSSGGMKHTAAAMMNRA